MWYDVKIDGVSGYNQGIYVVKRPNIPAPIRRYRSETVAGIDGDLYYDEKTYEDIVIAIEFNYMCTKDEWHDTFRKCKKWLMGGKTLILSDDLAFYHKIKKVEIGVDERVSYKIGKFTCEFTLDPYYYLVTGAVPTTIEVCKYNQYDESHPVYMITGEGVCTLNVNGSEMTANVGQNLTIDTDRKIAYRKDGTLQNTSVTGDYEDLYLLSGENTIDITDGFELQIIPSWRCI